MASEMQNPALGRGSAVADLGEGQRRKDTTDPVAGWIPLAAAEARIVLEAGRELWLTGGIHPDEGRRLRLAVERLERVVKFVAEVRQ